MTNVVLDRGGGGQRGKNGLIWDWKVRVSLKEGATEPNEKIFLDSHHPGNPENQQKEASVVAHALLTPVFGRRRQEDLCELGVSLVHIVSSKIK